MGKSTMATRLPRRLEENMKIVGEQIKLALEDFYLPSFRQRPIHGNQYQAPLPRIPAQREYELHSYCGCRYDNKAPQVYPSEESLLQSLYMWVLRLAFLTLETYL